MGITEMADHYARLTRGVRNDSCRYGIGWTRLCRVHQQQLYEFQPASVGAALYGSYWATCVTAASSQEKSRCRGTPVVFIAGLSKGLNDGQRIFGSRRGAQSRHARAVSSGLQHPGGRF